MGDRVELQQQVELQGAPAALFVQRVLERGIRHVRTDGWPTATASLAALGEPILRVFGDHGETALLELDGVLVQLSIFGGMAQLTAAHDDADELEATVRRLRDLLPTPDPTATHDVTVTFWTYGPHGPMPAARSIAVPEWEEIRGNYSAPTREKLEPLMSGFQPAHGGQLVLWHGEPGTGKTFGLRALAWEWREWCEFHYIVDPDTFFGQHADYLMNVLLQPGFAAFGWTSSAAMGDVDFHEFEGELGEVGKPWRLLILEDTGELLTADARERTGQGLSRFLNVVDGLIGQGLRVLALVTTNEPIRQLHPAVARPGRCAANVEFLPLAADEAADWLVRHGIEAPADGPALLASLYARREGFDPAEPRRATGFAV